MAEGSTAEAAAPAVAAPEVAAAPVPAPVEPLTPTLALKRVVRRALVVDGLRRGLHECAKALAKGEKDAEGAVPVNGARLCVLASDCTEASYVNLVKALCASNRIPLMSVDKRLELGEWCGLCKIDKEGTARKVVATSVAVITDFGETSPELEFLQKHLHEIGAL